MPESMISYENYPIFEILDYFDEIVELGLSMDEQRLGPAAARLKFLLHFVSMFQGRAADPECVNILLRARTFAELNDRSSLLSFIDYSIIQHSICGVVCFGEGGQIVYLILSESDTLAVFGARDRYIAAAVFVGESILVFEEGFVHVSGIKRVEETRFAQSPSDDPGEALRETLAILVRWIRDRPTSQLSPSFNTTKFEISVL